ncbi:MMPL family transporter [Kribbella ginsengisoli]|uniref:MMPL family transporter n=1 Tax=Kribbella ginsengisoli TaxID=363865 RepID=A0ABP6Z0X1_9ACTN
MALRIEAGRIADLDLEACVVALFLYRLGRLAFRRRWYVVLIWGAVLAVAGLAAGAATGLPSDTKSTPGGDSARVVFIAPAGQKVTDAGNRAAIEGFVAEVSRGSQVASAASPFASRAVSRDESVAYVVVGYAGGSDELTEDTRNQLRAAIDRAETSGLTVEVGGPVLADKPKVGGASELVAVALAAVILVVTFGSLVAAGLPLLTALLGVGISTLTILAVGDAFGLSTTTTVLASMLGLAVGIDYALFVVSRYREERAKGRPAQEAVGLAVGTAGSAVVFAGLTVVITLAGLTVLGIPSAGKMGLAAAGAVVVAVFIALTLVPALLGFWPDAVLSRRVRNGRSEEETENRGTRWARLVLRRPLPVLLATIAALVVLAIPVLDLQLGAPGDESRSTATTERRAYDALATAFGPGFNGPLTIVVDTAGVSDPKAVVATIAARIAETPGVVSVSPPRFDPARSTALFMATPSTAPASQQTKDLVHLIRDNRAVTEAGTGATFLVAGVTAADIDLADQVMGALGPYLAIVLSLAFLLLLTIFRSPIVPLEAVFGFLLSTGAALGAVVAVFQWGWGAELIGLQQTGPIISMMPVVLVGIIFGLAMDYEVFFVSRMREAHSSGESASESVVTGFRHSARIVVAAALIMVAVFSGFVGADLPMITMIGFALAVAVLLDAFVVRMTLVPALLKLTGEIAWSLPRRLDRILPQVDVEGAALRDRVPKVVETTMGVGA